MYGFTDKALVENLAAKLHEALPDHRFEVEPYDYGGKNVELVKKGVLQPNTWGVVDYEPYVNNTMRCRGFVWFTDEGTIQTPKQEYNERIWEHGDMEEAKNAALCAYNELEAGKGWGMLALENAQEQLKRSLAAIERLLQIQPGRD